jgi:hypothetical protein
VRADEVKDTGRNADIRITVCKRELTWPF